MRLLILFLLASFQLNAQVVDRYNFIQKPTDTSVTIAWRTAVSSIGTVIWGTSPGSLINTVSDPTATQKHNYEISGLTPNTRYYYQTSTNLGFLSAVDFFYTAMTPVDTKFTFLHYGDCGYDNSVQNQIASLMEADSTDFGVVAGDVDQGIGDDYDGVYFNVYKDILNHSCHFTAIGNHDTYADDAATYLDAFYLPTNNPQGSERYYSFEWGNAKFLCMDSNIPYTPGSDQYDWLVDELTCNESQWLFVFFHHPPWTNAWSADYYIPFTEYFLYQGNVDMRTTIVPLFEQYNVDFVLNGHSHCYQRGEMNDVKYVISGGAGSALLDFNTNSNAPNIDMEIYTNQYVRFSVDGDTVRYVAINGLGATIDSVTTIKPIVPPTPPVISLSGGDLSSTVGNNYTWYFNGVLLSGVTTQTYTPTLNGTYTVEITNEQGCILLSDPFIMSGLSVFEINQDGFRLYPNPSEGQITLDADLNLILGANLQICNSTGQLIYSDNIDENDSYPYTIHLDDVAKGMYLLKLETKTSRISRRFVLE